jgi:hypothetical protein
MPCSFAKVMAPAAPAPLRATVPASEGCLADPVRVDHEADPRAGCVLARRSNTTQRHHPLPVAASGSYIVTAQLFNGVDTSAAAMNLRIMPGFPEPPSR